MGQILVCGLVALPCCTRGRLSGNHFDWQRRCRDRETFAEREICVVECGLGKGVGFGGGGGEHV